MNNNIIVSEWVSHENIISRNTEVNIKVSFWERLKFLIYGDKMLFNFEMSKFVDPKYRR